MWNLHIRGRGVSKKTKRIENLSLLQNFQLGSLDGEC